MDETLEERLIELENRITFVLEALNGYMDRNRAVQDSVLSVLKSLCARVTELERPVHRIRVRRLPRA